MVLNYGFGCCAFAHDIRGSKPMIQAEMLDTSTPLTPEFFMNPRCPLGSSSVLSAVEPVKTAGEDFPAKDLPAIEVGVDIPSGPLARPNKATKG